ncbi:MULTISPECIES: hypothetical protein [Mesorhizobium]|uniref:hypothetical protein n=1 Tax=Mesorhizobium TaxID=68287 RepID=UPI00131521FD|nr:MULTISPECIES: hypothetical protein [Mesorhizobium]
MKIDPEGRAALRLIRETIEEHCPPGVYGPTSHGEAEALARAVVLSVCAWKPA